ncbi:MULTISPECIES: P63C domain-containing protein [Vibrio]|uniref:P63C domain-containing protein n=1 Tax=Vibrio TaxID=662 RepID=UPI000EFB329A|nr:MULTISPECIES: P63C domain-containing protein [Vibrio]MDN3628638.1 P63C domain-containing protein [Vibrio lentus]
MQRLQLCTPFIIDNHHPQTLSSNIDGIRHIHSRKKGQNRMILGDTRIDSYLIEYWSGQTERFMTLRGVQSLLGLTKKDSGQTLQRLVRGSLNPYLSEKTLEFFAKPIKLNVGPKNKAWVITTTHMNDVFKALVLASMDNALDASLSQLAKAAYKFQSAFALSRLNLLIDRYHGVETDMEQNELELWQELVLEEPRPLSQTVSKFPESFYLQQRRIYEKEELSLSVFRQLSFLGHNTNSLVWRQIDPELLAHIERKNPIGESGYRKQKFRQFISVYGEYLVQKFIDNAVIALEESSTMEEAKKLVTILNKQLKLTFSRNRIAH